MPPPQPIDEDPRAAKKRKLGKRHSRGMMIGGIVMTSLSGLPLLFAAAGMITGQTEIMLGGLAIGGALAGVGIPLIVIGGRHEPRQPAASTATIGPWLTPQGGGLGLRFEL